MNVCDTCIKGYPSQVLEREDFGDLNPGDWCFVCHRVYDLRIKRHVHKVVELGGAVHEVPGHHIDGWRPATGLELMEQSIADFDRLQ